MMESLRQESSIEIDQEIRLLQGRVLALVVDKPSSTILWTPSERRSIWASVAVVGPSRLARVWPGDTIIIPPHIGVKVVYFGQPALICNEDEVLAVKTEPEEGVLGWTPPGVE